MRTLSTIAIAASLICFNSGAIAGNGVTYEQSIEGKQKCELEKSEYKPVRHEDAAWRAWSLAATKSQPFTGCVSMNTARSFMNTSDHREYRYVYLKNATFLLHNGRWLHEVCFNDTDFQVMVSPPAPSASAKASAAPAAAPAPAATASIIEPAIQRVRVEIQAVVLPPVYAAIPQPPQASPILQQAVIQQGPTQGQVGNCGSCQTFAVAQKVKEEASAFCGIRTDNGVLFAIQRLSSGAAEIRRVLRVERDGSPVMSYPTGPGQRGHAMSDPKFKIEVGGDCNAAQLFFENNWHNLVLAFGQAGVQVGTRDFRLLGPVLAAKY